MHFHGYEYTYVRGVIYELRVNKLRPFSDNLITQS